MKAVNLTDFERKLLTVIRHNNKRGQSPSLHELEIRLGRKGSQINSIINDLMQRGWLKKIDGEWIVQYKLF